MPAAILSLLALRATAIDQISIYSNTLNFVLQTFDFFPAPFILS